MTTITGGRPDAMATAPTVAPEKASQTVQKPYPNYKVIVLNDDFNTFQHVAECLMKYIPGMTGDRAWNLTAMLLINFNPDFSTPERSPQPDF